MRPLAMRHLLLVAGALACAAPASAQNLIKNGQFNLSTGGWVARFSADGGSATFDPSRDADDSSASGSAAIATSSPDEGSNVTYTRCFALEPGAEVFWSGRVRFREGETATGTAKVTVVFYDGPLCTGNGLLGLSSDQFSPGDGRGVWLESTYGDPDAGRTAPAGTASASVGVRLTKASAGGTLTVNVDKFAIARVGTPLCDGQIPTLLGTDDADSLSGTPGTDVIAGRGGPDEIDGRGGFDTLCGNGGEDVLRGRGGPDVLLGGPGDDVLIGGGGADVLIGGGGADDACRGGGGTADLADPSCELAVGFP